MPPWGLFHCPFPSQLRVFSCPCRFLPCWAAVSPVIFPPDLDGECFLTREEAVHLTAWISVGRTFLGSTAWASRALVQSCCCGPCFHLARHLFSDNDAPTQQSVTPLTWFYMKRDGLVVGAIRQGREIFVEQMPFKPAGPLGKDVSAELCEMQYFMSYACTYQLIRFCIAWVAERFPFVRQ